MTLHIEFQCRRAGPIQNRFIGYLMAWPASLLLE
jgi:hypothetical protein